MGKFLIGEFGRKTWEFLLAADLTTIGRDPENDLVLEDVAVSRRHAQVLRQGRRLLLQDAGSSNGVFLNDERIPAGTLRTLRDGDRIRIGQCVMLLVRKWTARLRARSQTASPDATPAESEPPAPGAAVSLFALEEIEAALVFGQVDGIPPRMGVESDRVVIGSTGGCDIVLPHPSVSREHAEIVYSREGFEIVDRESRDGTFLNGAPVVVAALSNRSFLRFGSIKALFVFREAGSQHFDASFDDRDRLYEAFPERKSRIQSVFRDCREEALDFAEELVLHGILTPQEWWRVMGEEKSPELSFPRSWGSRWTRRRWKLPWGRKRR